MGVIFTDNITAPKMESGDICLPAESKKMKS